MFDLINKLTHPLSYPEIKLPMLIMQGCATLFGLILIPCLYIWSSERINPISWITNKSTPLLMVVVTSLIVISFMVTNSIFIEWNANFTFPDFMKEFGDWARERETEGEELTKFFTIFDTTGDFVFGILVIALLPAIGEELVFRGLLQPEFYRASGNHHVAIWTSAIIFSAFHMQFFGFIPRVFLGALFGYLYLWSENFLIPMIAHFVNNGFLVIMMYLNQKGIITMDMESPDAAPWSLVVSFTLVFTVLIVYFKRYHTRHNSFSV